MRRYSLYASWAVATIATLVSLYYSEILGNYPCKFCWYQRIFLFPLPLILFPIVYYQRRDFIPYILSLPLCGLGICLYQLFVHPSCCYFEPISPLISAATFVILILLLIFSYRRID